DRVPPPRADPDVAPAGGEPRWQPGAAGANPAGHAAGGGRSAVGPGRRLASHPLEVDSAPRRYPGQGVRPRADGRLLDRARPRALDPAPLGLRVLAPHMRAP